jgi:dTDP-glucose pyrophosphorylase
MATNILIPLAGRNFRVKAGKFEFPAPLVEVAGKTILEHVVTGLRPLLCGGKFIFIIKRDEARKYHLDSALRMITDACCTVIEVEHETKGAACSALLAIEHINNDDELIIANGDQTYQRNVVVAVDSLRMFEAGVLIFDCVHPRWSYAQVNSQGFVEETAEKNPISRNAMTGLYFFKRGRAFVSAAMSAIAKEATVNGAFYVSTTINELILNGINVKAHSIKSSDFFPLNSAKNIEIFEDSIRKISN